MTTTTINQPLTVKGCSGKLYNFGVYNLGTIFNPVPGVYIFLKRNWNSNWDLIYIGETEDLNSRLNIDLQNHHQWPAICLSQATHIAALVVNGGKSERLAIETDLRNNYVTNCNQQ